MIELPTNINKVLSSVGSPFEESQSSVIADVRVIYNLLKLVYEDEYKSKASLIRFKVFTINLYIFFLHVVACIITTRVGIAIFYLRLLIYI